MSMDQEVLILCYTPLARDPRVHRQIMALRHDYRLTVIGHGPPPELDEPVPHWIAAPPPGAWGTLDKLRCAAALLGGQDVRPHIIPARQALSAQLAGRRFAAVLANDLDTLPFAFRMAAGAPVIWDAHEYYLDDQAPTWRSRLVISPYMRRIAKSYIPRCTSVMTVCDGIARRYRDEFGVDPQIVLNAPEHAPGLHPTPTPERPIRLVHHGGMAASRCFDVLLDAVARLGNGYTLDLMLLPGADAAWSRLRRLVDGVANARLVPPVPMTDIPRRLNEGYDIGIHFLPPVSFNDRQALPNKFFEFIQARLAIATGPSPAMAELIGRHDLGVVADGFTAASAAAAIGRLDRSRIDACKANAHAAAAIYHAATARSAIRGIVADAIARRRTGR